MKNHGDPRQAVTPPASLWSVKKANGANSRSTATGAESGCDYGQDRHQADPAGQDQEQHERGAREPHPAAQGDPEQRAAERWDDDLPDQDGDPRGWAERPVDWAR